MKDNLSPEETNTLTGVEKDALKFIRALLLQLAENESAYDDNETIYDLVEEMKSNYYVAHLIPPVVLLFDTGDYLKLSDLFGTIQGIWEDKYSDRYGFELSKPLRPAPEKHLLYRDECAFFERSSILLIKGIIEYYEDTKDQNIPKYDALELLDLLRQTDKYERYIYPLLPLIDLGYEERIYGVMGWASTLWNDQYSSTYGFEFEEL